MEFHTFSFKKLLEFKKNILEENPDDDVCCNHKLIDWEILKMHAEALNVYSKYLHEFAWPQN